MHRRFSAALVIAMATAVSASAQTLRVVPSAQHPTIQSAVDAAGAGDVIQIKSGTYAAGVTLNSKAHLTIVGKGKVVLDATGHAVGLSVTDCSNVRIENLEVRSATITGTFLDTCARVTLKKVRAVGAGGNGIQSTDGFGLAFIQCLARDAGADGFQLDTSQSYVRRCDVFDAAQRGIELDGDTNTIVECKVRGTGKEGIWVHDTGSDCDANLIAKNQVVDSGEAGILLVDEGTGNTIASNVVKNSLGYGIESTCAGTSITDNKVIGSANSGYWIAGFRCVLRNNKATNVGVDGFFLQASTDFSTIHGNSVKGAADSGFEIDGSAVTFSKNTAKNCAGGNVDIDPMAVVLDFENGFDVN